MMDWKECIKRRMIKDINLDKNLIDSLKKSYKNKLVSSNLLRLNNRTAVSKIFLIYDSLRELLETISLQNGYKIYNHECYTHFLREILNEDSKSEEFDILRKIRNSINYYGKEISESEAKKVIKRIKNLISEMEKLLK